MTTEEVKSYLLENFKSLNIVKAEEDMFFMHPNNDKLPFVTILTKDNEYDSFSNLDRNGFFRLNFCMDKGTFKSNFGYLTEKKGLEAFINVGIDFTKEDTLLPHPTYGSMNWVCVVNPSEETFMSIIKHLESSFQVLERN